MNNQALIDYEEYVNCYRKMCKSELQKYELIWKERQQNAPPMPKSNTKQSFNIWLQNVSEYNAETMKQAEHIALLRCKYNNCRRGAMKDINLIKQNLENACLNTNKSNCATATKIKNLLQDPSKITAEEFIWIQTNALPKFK